ncbi:glycoside hydrolase family 3 N-terminal domain-containing protein [Thaumasiovibrio subtropicus]|uniref:glycoside hydrolase family 3 N-terminal domain-containing protein n=1 Tax=Thaumasiovibrio subtropicus TaxID=1891207 RepID=UPI000B3639CC|nr:glycoside hydrolase family 3 N-terminal domain-containing protein [Thaumasiovibrio subtropicus]
MKPIYKDATQSPDIRVADLLSQMTLSEKVGQLCQSPMLEYGVHRDNYLNAVREGRLGSRILADTAWAGNAPGETVSPKQLNEIQRAAVEESRLGIPVIVARDVIYGQQTVLPIPLAQAASFNPAQIEKAYRCVAKEAASLGIHWTFAPMLDVVRDPRWGRVIESGGEDPLVLSEMAKAVVKGFQGDDMGNADTLVACAKHFVGYGASEGGRDYDTTEISENSLHNVYLPPFKAAVEAGVGTLMSGFNDLGGTPVSGSQALIKDWLKTQHGFDGMVVSDWGSISDLAYFGVAADAKGAAKRAIEAGVDMAMTNEAYEGHLEALIAEGALDQAVLDEAVSRVLLTKFRAGLFERPYVDEEAHLSVMRQASHLDEARTLAEQSMVLLKNDHLLPIKTTEQPMTIAVIGPHAHSQRQHLGSWCLDGKTEDVTSLYAGIQAYVEANEINVTVITEEAAFADEMVECAHRADLVIFCSGESHRRTGEARNVAELTLPAGQEAMIEAVAETGKPLVVVQCTGRPLPSPATERYANALLYAWQSGTETGHAAARLLFGAVSPSGKLPISVPRSTGQVPIYYARKPLGKMRDFQDYQPYKDQRDTPLYPFGFGLSYGAFDYQDLKLDRTTLQSDETLWVEVTLTNNGEQAATEVVQCYSRQHVASTTRPQRELRAFQRVHLAAGESRHVSLEIPAQQFAFFGAEKTVALESSEITVFVGGDSNASLNARFFLNA